MKKIIFIALFFLAGCSPAIAQYNYDGMDSIIVNNIYENPNQIITGAILQGVMINQNKSYTNKVSDTSYIRDFDTITTFWYGNIVLHGGDTLYKAITNHSGRWRAQDFKFYGIIGVSGGGGGSYTPTMWTVISTSAATINVTAGDFNGYTIYQCTNSAGVETINLPNPTTVTANTALYFTMLGGNAPELFPFFTEMLDNQALPSGLLYWLVPTVSYIRPSYIYPQKFGLYMYTNNWYSKN